MQDAFTGRLTSTRGGALLIGGIAALLAAVLLVVYLRQYRSSVDSGSRPMSVLVAKSLIPKNTPGKVIAQRDLFQVASLPRDQLKDLAISDPAAVNGRVALSDIYPGQQLTAADFTAETTTAVPTQITGRQRAIAIPVDSAHGAIGAVAAGDHVDVYVGLSSQQGATAAAALKLLASDIVVLSAPGVGAATGGNALLRVTAVQAPKVAFASDNGRIWLIVRPQSGAKPTPPSLVTVATLLAGSGR